MTFSSQYLDDLSRVRLELSDLYPEPNGAVKIERSANASMVPSDVVRGAMALPLINPDGLNLDGSAGNYASTPDSASLDITGDIDLRVDATVEWVGGAATGQVLVAKFGNTDGTESYQLGMHPDGLIDFVWSTDGTDVGIDDARSTVPVVPGSDGRLAIRATMDVDAGNTRLILPGDSGSYASTPDDASLDITGDIDIRVLVAPDDWTAAGSQVFAAKRESAAGEESWQFYVNSDGRINFAWWDSTEALTNVLGEFIQDETGIGDGEQIALRVVLDVDTGSSEHTVTFYSASTLGGPWTQLGDVDTGSGTTSVFASTAAVEVGSRDGGTANLFTGIVHAAEVRDGIDGTVVADPDFTAQANGTTSFTDSAGNTWTVNGDAMIDSSYAVTFYTAPTIDGPWTQLGEATIGPVSTSIFSGPAELAVGGRSNGGAFPPTGVIHAVEVYDGIGGTLAADPYFASETAATSSFSDSSGNTWTVNGTAEIVKGVWAQVDDYEFYADVENFYRATRVDPESGLFLGGVEGDYASTPDTAALDITGDIDIRVDATLDDWASGDFQAPLTKWLSPNRSYGIFIEPTGEVRLAWSTDGTSGNAATSTIVPDVEDGERLALRATLDVDDGAGGWVARFYTATSIEVDDWILLGDPVDNSGGGTTSIFDGTQELEVGSEDGGSGSNVAGTVHAAEVRDGINGTVASDPDFSEQPSQTTSFTDDAGRTWTVQGGAVIWGIDLGGANTTSITPDLDGVTWLKSVTYPALNRPLGEAPEYRPVQRSSRTGVFNIKGRVPPIAVYDAWTSRWWTMEFVTNTLAAARDMDLVLAASRTLFIHVPRESENECFTNPVSGMPGGYVMAQNATMRHTVGGSHVMQWVLPVRQVAPPAPEVSGGTLTWETIRRLYGSWTALWAAYSSWNELWETIMDPEDALSL